MKVIDAKEALVSIAKMHGYQREIGQAVLIGKFGESGVLVIGPMDRAFECAIRKADCEVVIAGMLQRFVAETEAEEDPATTAEREKAYDLLEKGLTGDSQSTVADAHALLDKLPERPRKFLPKLGWVPMLCAGTDTLQLQGMPNATWRLEIAFVSCDVEELEAERKAFYEERKELHLFKPRQYIPCPTDGATVEIGTEFSHSLSNDMRK